MDTIGVGLVKRGGNYYAVEDFAATVAQLGPEQVEQKIGQLLQQRGLQPAGLTQDARQTCEMDTVRPEVRSPGSSCAGRERI